MYVLFNLLVFYKLILISDLFFLEIASVSYTDALSMEFLNHKNQLHYGYKKTTAKQTLDGSFFI